MSTFPTRRSVLIASGAAAVALSGLFAARLGAHQTGAGLGPGPRAPRVYQRAVRQLGLTEDQQTRVRGILRAHADAIEAQIRAGAAGRRALRAATLAQPADETEIRRLALELGAIKAESAVLRARIRSEIWPILTAEQQEKARTLRSKEGRRGKRRLEALDRWLRAEG
jgi:Spy/CpxP family protein refolding chaperone